MMSSSDKGFTLVEVLVTLTILALVTGVSVAAFTRSPGVRLTGEVREIAAVLRQTRSRSQALGQVQTVAFDVANREILASNWTGDFPDGAKLTATVPTEEVGPDGQAKIRFFPEGLSTGGRIDIELAGTKRSIVVPWLGGQILVYDGEE